MAKAKESYEEWKKRKEQEGTLPASTTQRSATSAGSSYKPKESYEEWKARKEGKTSSNNLITSFLTDSRAYLSSAQKEYDSLNYQTGKSTYVKRMTDAERLKARGRQIQQYIDRSVNSSEYADLKKYLEEFEKSADNVLDAFRSSADFYGQFESEEKYNEYAAYQKDREEKSVFDLDAGQKEIAAMEQELAELKRQKSTDDSVKSMQNLYAGSTYAAAQGDIKSDRDLKIREMEQQISSKKQYLNDAKRIQDGATLASVSGNDDFDAYNGYVSTKNDSVRGQFGMGYDDLTYEYINGDDNGMRQSIINKAVSYDADTEKFFSYDHMTPDQIAIYNYHYAKDGKEAAEKYLNSIQETLNDKAATERFEKMKDRTALELVFGLEAGLDQFQSGVKNLFNTNDDYIPQTATQMASGMVREDLADNGFNFWYNFKDKEWQGTILGNSVGQVAYDAITTSANMAPSILASIAADFILPGSGAYVGSGLMGGSAAGNAYQEALNEGYDKNQARGYGLLVGASEIVMEKVLGGISAVGGNALGKYLTRNVSAADTALKMIGKRLGASAISEFSEEYLQEVLTPVFQNIMLDTNNEVKLFSAEALYSGILGALTAGIMEGPTVIGGEVRTNRTGKQLKAAGVSAQRLADIGKTFAADTVAYHLAGKVDENTNAYTMGRLFYEIGATLTEQNVSDITEALVAKGWDRDVAAKNAKVMAAVVDGEKLSDKEVAIIEANDSLAEAMRTTIVDPNATWFQRNKGYNDIAMTLAQKMTATKSAKTKQSLPGQENAVASEQADTAKEIGAEETPAPSRVQSITRIQGENVTVKLEDGSEVSIKDADLDPYDGVMIETIARIDGISAEDANYIFNALKAAPGARADFTARGAEEAYRYGYYGFDDKYIAEHGVFANSLTETQRKTIYEKGRLARQTKVDSKNATAAKKNATTEKTSTAGRVHFDGDRTKLNSRRKASLSALDKIAEITGLQVYVFTSYLKGNKRVYLDENGVEKAAPNGWYDPSDNSIHIDLNAGANGEGTMLFTLAHELTHHIRKWSPTKFKTLADFLMQEYGKKGVNVDALVREQMAKAKRHGRTISYDTAYEEMVADSMEMMLSDGNVLNRLEKLKARDKDLWFEIKDFINKLADKIRRVYKDLTPDSDEAMIVADMGKAVYKLQELFAEGLMEASENYQASLTPGVEGTIVNQNGDPVAHSTADGTIQLSMRTYEEEGREAFRKYLQKCVSSKKLTKAEMQDMIDGIEEIYEICKEFKDKYAPFSSWSDAAVVRDTHGKPVFSVVTPNGDYKMNLDFSLVCKKRRTLDAVFNEMSRRGIIDDFELGQKSVVKINEIIRRHGLETACALCFVDAKRFRQASMADQFTSLYNELVESLVPEDQRGSIDHFNFSGYATIKKVEGGIDTWDNSKLDFSHINHVMKTYGDGTVEYKAAKYIKTHAEGRKLLLRGDFMSSQGFDAVKTQNQDILKLYNSKKGTGGPKAAFGDVQYLNEIIQKARWWTPKKAYEVGGIRIQSFSDYVPRMVFDYVQMIYDLAATKLPAHAYTKEALFVKQFGLTGIKINMSLIPAIAEGGIAPGLDANGNYVWAGESFDFETAKEIQNAEGYTENCGTICVGVSYKHIVKLLGDPNIRMVIPYHKSGLNPIVAHMNKIAEFTDYTTLKTNPGGCQNTIDKNGSKVEVDFNFNETLRKTGDPKATVRQYLDWCSKHEYTPRFAEFAWHENYYKLIEDFTLYDKDGKYVPQREVRAVFPNDSSAFGSMKDLIQEGLQEDAVVEGKRDQNLSAIVDEIQRTIPKTEAEIAEEQVAQADRDLEALKYSSRDYARQVDEVKNNTHDPLNHVYMGTTPVGIVNILELPKLPMLVTPQHIYAMAVSKTQAQHDGRFKSRINYHNLGWDTVKKIPEYINKPVLIIKSNTDPNDATFVVVTAQSDDAGNPIIVAVKPNGRGNYFNIEFPTNFMLSGYGKDGIQGYVARAKTENRILYANKNSQKKNTPSVQFADNILSSDYTNNLAQFKSIVKSKFAGTIFENSGLPKFSDRDTESVSNRSLLANAFESVAQSDIERNRIREYRKKISQMEEQERKLGDLNQQIKELSFTKGPRDTAKIKDLRDEATKVANRINIYDKQLLRMEASAPLQAVLDREKKKAVKRMASKWEDSRKRAKESHEKTAMRHKIQNVVKKLNSLLLTNDKKRHVPDNLKKAVAEALNAVNMDTVGAEERIAKLQQELMKAKTPEAIQEISKKIDNVREMGDRMDEKLKRLKEAYDEFINSDDPLIANSHDDAVSGHMMTLIVRVGDTPLRDMTLDQLQDVYDVYNVVLATVRNANKSFKDNKNREISTRANQVMAEIDNLGVKRGKRPVFMNWIEKFGWDNLKPVYAMEHIGSRGLIDAYNNVRAGEDTWALDVTEAREYYLEKFRKYKYDSWDFEKKSGFTSTTGKDFELTLDQIMSLYAYSKRDQAEDHLRYGGIVFDPKTEVVEKTKSGIKVKYNVANATAYNISEETLSDIISKLTPEQKGFVDEMQAYLSDVMGAKGNEVSLAMYDVKLFREKNYFPLKSAHQYMAKAKEQAQGDVKIKNSGFSKETKPHAKNPIVLSSFMDVWSNHVNEMSMYHAFVLPMEDFYRIYNYTTPSKNENMPTEGVNAYIENAYGSGATDYIEQMLKDLNGGARTDSRTGFINKMMGKFKKGAVFASLSVVVQQPSAIARAAALVDTKYFIGPKVDHKRHKQLWNEVKQYAPVAIIKEMGYFDTNMGKSTQDFIMGKEYSGIKEQAKALFADSNFRDEILSKLPALADEVAWCGIWEAVKRETNAKYPSMDTKSEAFLQKVGERFTEVITKTQVYDSVLARSANMRSKDTGMKMATAFMAEPTTSINMIADALLKGKRGNRKYARTAIGAVIASQILNSILVSFVYASRDDDEDETFWEKYIGSVVGEILDGLNPAGYIPFIKDIQSIVKGYDVERSDMAVISDLWKATQNLTNDKVSAYQKVEGFVGSIAQLFGLPAKNIMRDVRAFWNTFVKPIEDKVNGVRREKMTMAGVGYAIKSTAPKWLGGGDVSNQQQLYEAYLSGNKAQIARVESRYKNQSAINSALRAALRENDLRIHEAAEARFLGDFETYKEIFQQIRNEGRFSFDDIMAAVNAEVNKLEKNANGEVTEQTAENDSGDTMFKAKNYYSAVVNNDPAEKTIYEDLIAAKLEEGYIRHEAEDAVANSFAEQVEKAYMDGDIDKAKAIQLLKAKTEKDAETEVKKWDFEIKYGFSWGSRVRKYRLGKISKNELLSAVMDIEGETKSGAEEYIKFLDLEMANSTIDITANQASSYFKYAQPAGISIKVYTDYRSKASGIKKKEDLMDIIDSLPINSAQKDALYYAEGWAASKLNEAPWH